MSALLISSHIKILRFAVPGHHSHVMSTSSTKIFNELKVEVRLRRIIN